MAVIVSVELRFNPILHALRVGGQSVTDSRFIRHVLPSKLRLGVVGVNRSHSRYLDMSIV